jgi:cytolysin (calcineurin-like family phosphatase)
MPLLGRKTDEEKVERAAAKEASRQSTARAKLRGAFDQSAAGQARAAFERGDQVFQYEVDIRSQKAVVRKMQSAVAKETLGSRLSRGPVATLNAVCDEGWELVNGSFVFVETGQQSRDKFMSSGQQVAISGTVMGYYLFKRNETNKVRGADPWELDDQQALELADEVEG